MKLLQDNTSHGNVFSLEALSHCFVALARDLSVDFLQYFETAVATFVHVLDNCQGLEAVQIDVVFRSLATICHLLGRSGRVDASDILRKTVRIRHHKKQFVRKFAAMALAVVIRAAQTSISDCLMFLFAECNGEDESTVSSYTKIEAVTMLLHFSICGQPGSLHSKAALIFQELFNPCFAAHVQQDIRLLIVRGLIHLLAERMTQEGSHEVLRLLFKSINNHIPQSAKDSFTPCSIIYLIELVILLTETKFKLSESRYGIKVLSNFIEVSIASTIFHGRFSGDLLGFVSVTARLISALMDANIMSKLVLMQKIPWFDYVTCLSDEDVLHILRALHRGSISNSEAMKDLCIDILSDIGGNIIFRAYKLSYLLGDIVHNLQDCKRPVHFRYDLSISEKLKQICSRSEYEPNERWCMLRMLPHFMREEDVQHILNHWLSHLLSLSCGKYEVLSVWDSAMLFSLFEARVQSRMLRVSPDWSLDFKLISLALSNKVQLFSSTLIQVARLLLYVSDDFRLPEYIFEACVNNLASRNRFTRTASLNILWTFFGSDHPDQDHCRVCISTFLHMNDFSADTANMLEYSRKCVNLTQALCRSVERFSEHTRSLVMRMALGALHLRFAHIWTPVIELIGILASRISMFEILKVELLAAKCELFEDKNLTISTGYSTVDQICDEIYVTVNPQEKSTDVSHRIDNLICSLTQCSGVKMHARFVCDFANEVLNMSSSGPYDYVAPKFSSTVISTLKLMQTHGIIQYVIEQSSRNSAEIQFMTTSFSRLSGDANESIAHAALKCLEMCELDYLPPGRIEQLCLLTNSGSLKHGLATLRFEGQDLNICQEFPAILSKYREVTTSLIIRVLSKYISGKSKKFKVLRPLVLKWFSYLEMSDLKPVIYMFLRPVVSVDCLTDLISGDCVQNLRSVLHLAIENSNCVELCRFMSNVRDTLKAVPMHFQGFSHLLIIACFQIFHRSCEKIGNEQDVLEDSEMRQLKSARSQSLRLLACIIPFGSAEIVEDEWFRALDHIRCISKHLVLECCGIHIPPVLDFIASIVNCEHLTCLLNDVRSYCILEHAFRVLTSLNTSAASRQVILTALSRLMAREHRGHKHGKLSQSVELKAVCEMTDIIFDVLQKSLIISLERGSCPGDELIELTLLCKLEEISGQLTWNSSVAEDIMDIACGVRANDGKCAAMLGVLCRIISKLRLKEEQVNTYIDKLSHLLSKLRLQNARFVLLSILQTLCEQCQRISAASILKSLNSYVEGQVDEIDYDRRLLVYQGLVERFSECLDSTTITLILNQALYDVRDNNPILQNVAKSLIYKCLNVGDFQDEDSNRFRQLSSRVLLPGITRLLNQRNYLVRNCALELLRCAILAGYTPEIRIFSSKNEDLDVCLNLSHIQAYRRARALRKLCDPEFSSVIRSESFRVYVLPVVVAMLCDSNADVAATAVTTLGYAAQVFESQTYFRTLRQLIKRSPTHRGNFRYRAAAYMLERYPFKTDLACAQKCENLEMLQHIILPQIESNIIFQLHDDSRKTVSTLNNISFLCFANTLPLLDAKHSAEALARVLKIINTSICSRHQGSRDSAMDALRCISSKIGQNELSAVIQSLQSTLNNGMHAHFLSKGIYISLSSCKYLMPEIAMDIFIQVAPSLRNSLFGYARDHREPLAVKRPKDAKLTYSFDIISLFAKILFEHKYLTDFISTLMCMLPGNSDVQSRKCCGNILKAVRNGLLKGSDAHSERIIFVVSSLIEERLKDETSKTPHPSVWSNHVEYSLQITNFAMDVLHDSIKKLPQSKAIETLEGQVMLKPVMQLMVRCMSSALYDVQVGSTRVILKLLRVKSSTVDASAKEIGKRIITLLKSVATVDDLLAQNCLRILAVLIRNCDVLTLTLSQMSFVVSFAFQNLKDKPTTMRPSFILLNAMISKRISFEGLYELMDEILVMVTCSSSGHLRDICSYATIQFFLNYPLGERHVNGLLQNLLVSLDYAQSRGRLSALNTLHGVLLGFPVDALNEHSAAIFLPLVLRIAYEDDKDCRKIATTTLRLLLSRVNTMQAKALLSFIENWSKRNDCLKQAAHQLLLIGLEEHTSAAFDIFLRLESHLLSNISMLVDSDYEAKEWSKLYCLLKCFERAISVQQTTIEFAYAVNARLLTSLPKTLRYSHSWVQNTAISIIKLCASLDYGLSNLVLGEKWLVLKGIVQTIECRSRNVALTSSVLEDTITCLSLLTEDFLKSYESTQGYIKQLFSRMQTLAAISDDAMATALLRWVARLMCTKYADLAANQELSFHAANLCRICLKSQDDSEHKSQSVVILAKDILAAAAHTLPREHFNQLLQSNDIELQSFKVRIPTPKLQIM